MSRQQHTLGISTFFPHHWCCETQRERSKAVKSEMGKQWGKTDNLSFFSSCAHRRDCSRLRAKSFCVALGVSSKFSPGALLLYSIMFFHSALHIRREPFSGGPTLRSFVAQKASPPRLLYKTGNNETREVKSLSYPTTMYNSTCTSLALLHV